MDIQDSSSAVRSPRPLAGRWALLGRHFGFPILFGAMRPLSNAWRLSSWSAKRLRRFVQLGLSLSVAGLLVCAWINTSDALMTAART